VFKDFMLGPRGWKDLNAFGSICGSTFEFCGGNSGCGLDGEEIHAGDGWMRKLDAARASCATVSNT
jgi:hypothetical protein